MTDKCWDGGEKEKSDVLPRKCQNQNDPYRDPNDWGEPYRNEWEMPKGKGKQNDPYRYTNTWEEPYRSEWEMPKGKGKGQGVKGDPMLKPTQQEEFSKRVRGQ